MTAIVEGAGSRGLLSWSTGPPRYATHLHHEKHEREATPPLFELPARADPPEPFVSVVSVATSTGLTAQMPPQSEYFAPLRLKNVGVSVVGVADVHDKRGAKRRAGMRVADQPVGDASRVRDRERPHEHRSGWAALLDGTSRLFNLTAPVRKPPTIEEALLEAMVQLDEAGKSVTADQPEAAPRRRR